MFNLRLNCQSVALFVMSFMVMFSNSFAVASGDACRQLFLSELRSEVDVIVSSGLLTSLRTSNPYKDHNEYFAAQIPLVLNKVLVRYGESLSIFERAEHKPAGKKNAEKFQKSKDHLERNFHESYNLLLRKAEEALRSRTVTYEWYMDYFLKAMIFSDVALRIQDSTSMKQFEGLKKQLDTLLGNSKVFISENSSELQLYSSLGRDFSRLTRDSYFTRGLLEETLIPVLFVPKDIDIIRAEKAGIHFITLNGNKKITQEGVLYPLQFASKQAELRVNQLSLFRDLVNNSKSKWIRFHDKIVSRIEGNKDLEALYAFILKNAELKSELTKRFDVGYKIIISFDAHKSSQYLEYYFKTNQREVSRVANQETQSAFLAIIHQIEKEALDSRYH